VESEFYTVISQTTAHRYPREVVKFSVLKNPKLFQPLVVLACTPEDPNHHKACWILELVCEQKLKLLRPHMNLFCNTMPRLTHEGALRSMSKIVLFLSQKTNLLNQKQEQLLLETCWSWLLEHPKVATKVNAMRSLYYFGYTYLWIHPELRSIIQLHYSSYSAGYQAAAKDILRKLDQNIDIPF
jgi:hypothetical protein